jgi:cell division protein ZapA
MVRIYDSGGNMSKDKHKVTVQIGGEIYNLKGDLEPEKVQKLAEMLDRRMRKIAQFNPRLSQVKVAVLAALNIADEYLKLEQDYQQVMKMLKEGK